MVSSFSASSSVTVSIDMLVNREAVRGLAFEPSSSTSVNCPSVMPIRMGMATGTPALSA